MGAVLSVCSPAGIAEAILTQWGKYRRSCNPLLESFGKDPREAVAKMKHERALELMRQRGVQITETICAEAGSLTWLVHGRQGEGGEKREERERRIER